MTNQIKSSAPRFAGEIFQNKWRVTKLDQSVTVSDWFCGAVVGPTGAWLLFHLHLLQSCVSKGR